MQSVVLQPRGLLYYIGQYGPAVVLAALLVATYVLRAWRCVSQLTWILVVVFLCIVAVVVLEWTCLGNSWKRYFLSVGAGSLRPRYDAATTPLTLKTSGNPSAHTSAVVVAVVLGCAFLLMQTIAGGGGGRVCVGGHKAVAVLVMFAVFGVCMCLCVAWQRVAYDWHTRAQVVNGAKIGLASAACWLGVAGLGGLASLAAFHALTRRAPRGT